MPTHSHTTPRLRGLAALLLTVALLALAGCAEERPPLDRVQPNALEKEMFQDVWYYQRTVVDVPSGAGFTFVGASDFQGLTRITWDVQEDFLYARRFTELVQGADDRATKGEDYSGEVVAAYRIEKHFDITKAYNAATGEELNILEENAIDRPWYERDYMRVDWSQNLVTNYDLDFEAASIEPVSYFVQEIDPNTGERHADAPFFAETGNYFDVTNKIFARAGMTTIEGYGDVPLCWLRGEELTECGAGEYTLRNSFLKLDPNRQYQALPYKGKPTDVFGFFETSRLTYDPQTGIREQGRERYLNRHNLWRTWTDADGNLIPGKDRILRPIVYHVNTDMPEELKPIIQDVADQWNAAFSDVVEAEGYELKDGERVFIACLNNPVQEGDPIACGAPGNSPRIGDIRYSFMAYIPKYMKYGLLGLGPSNNDPETGEIISGMAYVYHHNNLAAYQVQEYIELLNGTRDAGDYIDGVDLQRWIKQVNGEEEAPERTHGLEAARPMVERLANGQYAKLWEGMRAPITEADEQAQAERGFDAWVEPHLEFMYNRGLLNGERNANPMKVEHLQDTYIEDMLLHQELLLASGHTPNTPVLDVHVHKASPAREGVVRRASDRNRALMAWAEARNMYLPEMADDALMGLARELKDAPPEEVYQTVYKAIYTAVMAHEVGHSLGLMHNFGGSDDAINYFDDYWKLRDDGEIDHRLNDPLTDAEINGKIYNYAYSSVMDYAGRYTIDGAGIGKYDRAAMLFGYAQKVEVFRDHEGVRAGELRDWFERDGDLLSFTVVGPRSTHYTSFYNRMGPSLYEADNRFLVDVADLSDDFSTYTEEVEGEEVEYSRVPYIYCSHNRANLGDSCLTRDFGADPYERMKNILDDLNTWYIARSFPRGGIGVDNSSYVSRYYGRVYDRLKNWHNLYGLYAALLPQFFNAQTLENFYTDPTNGWGGQTWAVQNAFNYLVQTLLMPDVGGYGGPYRMADDQVLMLTGVSNPSLQLGVTDARYYSTSWGDGDRDCGYQWYECLHHVGFYLDKIMAIEALTDSNTNFVARATPEDIRQWEVSYYSTFPEQISAINDAIMAQKWGTVGPYHVPGPGEMRFPNYTGDLLEEHGQPVDPFATFTIALYWQVMGRARFPSTFNQRFLEESRIYIEGTGQQPNVDAEDLVRFTDPTSNLTYIAIRRPSTSAAESMIRRANTLTANSSYCDDTKTATLADDCTGAGGQLRSMADFELMSYIQLIQVVADLNPAMAYGDPYNP